MSTVGPAKSIMSLHRNPGVGDLELVNMVGEYLVEHANLNYVDLQDMVETIQATSYRYSRMKKQVFSNMVRKAYQTYCEQNNLLHPTDADGMGSHSHSGPTSSDSDVEIEETRPVSSVMKNQLTNLYQSPRQAVSDKPASKLPFKPAFEMPQSLLRKPSSGSGAPQVVPRVDRVNTTPRPVIKARDNDDNDLEIIEEVNGSVNNMNPSKDSPKSSPVLLEPKIIRNNHQSASLPPKNIDNPMSSSVSGSVSNNEKIVNQPDKEQEYQDKRGVKRKADEADVNESTSTLRHKKTILRNDTSKETSLVAASRKGKKQVTIPTESNITFSDFGGNEKVVEEICKLLMHLKHPEIYRDLGVVPPRGFLLHGPPGCGKSLLASAIAGELKIPMLKMAATELISGISGESESNIRDLFEQGVALSPCIIFIDEIDAITPRRETAQREMERRIVSQLLACIDELSNKEKGDQVLLIGATNRVETIDSALRRAGRFDREISLGIPDVKAREQILRVLFRNLRLSPDFNVAHLARLTPGYVGADLQGLMREAAVQSVDKILNTVTSNSESDDEVSTLNKDESDAKKLSSVYSDGKPVELVRTSTNEIESKDTSEGKTNSDTVSDSNRETSLLSGSAANTTVASDRRAQGRDFLKWIRETTPLTSDRLENICLQMEDFEKALKYVQPSSKREGFATVPDTTWDDIGALKEIREELQVSILGPVKHSSAFQSLGLNRPAGVLLCGPPGCGKTLLAKAVANEAGINFISVKGPELLNMYVGESERAVRQCFLRAKNSSPCVIFFDELDALCPRRSDGIESGSTSRVVNQLLTEMDGIESRIGVFVMAATNRPDIIDPAILRPGRLDKVVFVNLPTAEDRFDILNAITKNSTLPRFADDVNLEDVAMCERLEGFTGADLAAIVREASVAAFRELVLDAMKNNIPVCPDSDLKVFNRHIETAIARTKRSVTKKDQEKYTQMQERYSNVLSC